MTVTRRHADRRPLRWRIATGTVGAIGLVGAAGAVAAAVIVVAFARGIVLPRRRPDEVIRIRGIDRGAATITLSEHPESVIPGRYGLWFAGDTGHAKVGEILSRRPGSVTRSLIAVDAGTPRVGMRCRISGMFYLTPEELGVDYSEVLIPTALGDAPAWLVPARAADVAAGRWVVQVHGRGVTRSEGIRAVPVFREAGYTSLLISYRNDGVAPPSVDGRYGLGDVEWRDVEAAMRFALDHGATDIVLMGWSMGGATVLQAVTRSPLASAVRGIVLDCPVVDWVDVLDHQAGTRRIPRLVRAIVLRALASSWGRPVTGLRVPIDLRRLDFVRRAGELRVPILLLHSSGDQYVPRAASAALALARPDIVTFPEITVAGHTRIWNYDSRRWAAHIRAWLEALGREA